VSGVDKRKIILGVTGGIAAYKAALLVRVLRTAGAEVRVVMTPSAQAFVTPLTFQALSGSPVYTELLDEQAEAAMDHISLARWADLVLVAPASAHFLARLACGMADNLLTTLCLATCAPIAVAPAMNRQMWLNPATQDNIQKIQHRGCHCWGPAEGEQACGETGPGRMLEPEQLVERVVQLFSEGPLSRIRVLLTSGSTREPIDPVRYVGNRSSGKMGFALAEALSDLGAEVTLISGPASIPAPQGIPCHWVETAHEMRTAVMERVGNADIFVGVAAVADYRPRQTADEKIKKNKDIVMLELVRNPDILAEVAARDDAPFCVGFAAETEQVEVYAEAKRQAKGLDLIAANQVGAGEGGFESDNNALVLLWEGGREALPLMPKRELARRLAGVIARRYRPVEQRT
jgi:phosphopantothenoylcysteine decarboxylase / phosphopantothenate---cysteine ligase